MAGERGGGGGGARIQGSGQETCYVCKAGSRRGRPRKRLPSRQNRIARVPPPWICGNRGDDSSKEKGIAYRTGARFRENPLRLITSAREMVSNRSILVPHHGVVTVDARTQFEKTKTEIRSSVARVPREEQSFILHPINSIVERCPLLPTIFEFPERFHRSSFSKVSQGSSRSNLRAPWRSAIKAEKQPRAGYTGGTSERAGNCRITYIVSAVQDYKAREL